MIFIHPIWWNGPPAILKGFFDRVLLPRFAYKFEKGMPIKLLNKKAVLFVSHGGPKLYTDFILRNRGIKIITKDTLGFCGIKTKVYKINNAKKLNEKKEKEIEKMVFKGLKFIT